MRYELGKLVLQVRHDLPSHQAQALLQCLAAIMQARFDRSHRDVQDFGYLLQGEVVDVI